MEQAGINSVFLVEAKNLTYRFDSSGNVDSIAGDGVFIEIDSSFTIELLTKEARNRNGKIGYSYNLSFTKLESSIINALRRSIYGFVPIMNTNDGFQKIIPSVLNFNESNQDNNISASYLTKLSNFVVTDKQIVLFNNKLLDWILDTSYWNDNAYWIDSSIWID